LLHGGTGQERNWSNVRLAFVIGARADMHEC